MKTWSEVEQSPDYQNMPADQQTDAKKQYFEQVVVAKPEFQSLPDSEKHDAATQFLGQVKPPVDNSSPVAQGFSGPLEQHITKQLYEHVPFGKDIIKLADPSGSFDKKMSQVQPANDIGGNTGDIIGLGLANAPAFVAGEAFAAPGGLSKLASGAIGVGAQATTEAKNKGATDLEALKQGAETTTGTVIGGKVLEVVGNALTRIPQTTRDVGAYMHNQVVKLPKGAYNYSKDPLSVLNKEDIVANSTSDYADQAQARLDQRSQELKDAVKNSDKTVDISNLNDQIETAKTNALKSTNVPMRTKVIDTLQGMQDEIGKKGDLTNMPLQDAVELKQQLAKDYPFDYGTPRTSTANTPSSVAHSIHHTINEAIDKVDPSITDLNQRVSGLIDITKAAENQVQKESRNHAIGLIGTIVGSGAAGAGGGALIGRNPLESGIEGALAYKAITSPFVLTRIARALNGMADMDKLAVLAKFPWLKKANNPDIQNEVKRLTYQPSDVPKYLKDRQSAPIDTLGPKGGVIPAKAPEKPLGLPAPQADYLKQRANTPIPSLGVKGNPQDVLTPKTPIPLSKTSRANSTRYMKNPTPGSVVNLNEASVKIPEFKNTEEALSFGDQNKNNKHILKALNDKYQAGLSESKRLNDSGDEAGAFYNAQRNQLYREALERAQGKIKTKIPLTKKYGAK